MQEHLDTLALKAAAGGSAALAGTSVAVAGITLLTLGALVVAALLGVLASLHFQREQIPASVPRLMLQVYALTLLGVLLALGAPEAPLVGGWIGRIDVVVRAGFFGLLANPAYAVLRAGLEWAAARLGRA